jgi:hypothetical protein
MTKKPKPRKPTNRWLKKHGFTNALWRLEERDKARKLATRRALEPKP